MRPKAGYRKIDQRQKKAATYSVRIAVFQFLSNYRFQIEMFPDEELLVDSIYFFWFYLLSEKRYKWCDEMSQEFFDEDFIRFIKVRIQYYIKKNINNAKKQTVPGYIDAPSYPFR